MLEAEVDSLIFHKWPRNKNVKKKQLKPNSRVHTSPV